MFWIQNPLRETVINPAGEPVVNCRFSGDGAGLPSKTLWWIPTGDRPIVAISMVSSPPAIGRNAGQYEDPDLH